MARVGSSVPLTGPWGRSLTVEGYPVLALKDAPMINHTVASPGYFRTLGMTLLEGFVLRDSPEFDDWQAREADTLERELAKVARKSLRQILENSLSACRDPVEVRAAWTAVELAGRYPTRHPHPGSPWAAHGRTGSGPALPLFPRAMAQRPPPKAAARPLTANPAANQHERLLCRI